MNFIHNEYGAPMPPDMSPSAGHNAAQNPLFKQSRNQDISKRAQILNARRNEKLKHELVARFGINYHEVIDAAIGQRADALFAEGRSFKEALELLSQEISRESF